MNFKITQRELVTSISKYDKETPGLTFFESHIENKKIEIPRLNFSLKTQKGRKDGDF